MIVSDDPLFVQATSLGFRAGSAFLVFHCPASGRVAAQATVRVGADVVIVDDPVGAGDRFDLVGELCDQVEPPPVLVLSDLEDPERDLASLEAGATMVVSRGILGGALVSLVAALASGQVLVQRDLARRAQGSAGRLCTGGPPTVGETTREAGGAREPRRLIHAA